LQHRCEITFAFSTNDHPSHRQSSVKDFKSKHRRLLMKVGLQTIDLQQRLDNAQDELAESGAAIERSVQQNQELETQIRNLETRVKGFGVPNEDAQRQEEAAYAANARSDEQIARLEQEVEKLKSREGALLEANHHHELDVHALEVEKKRLEVALNSEQASRKAEIERLVISHAQEAEKVVVEHQKAIDELKSGHVEDLDGLKQERLAVVEQIQLSHDQDVAKLRTAHEQTLTNTKSKHESHVKKLKSNNDEEIERWQQTRHKLEEERKADLQTLRTVRTQLETSKSDLKSRLVQADRSASLTERCGVGKEGGEQLGDRQRGRRQSITSSADEDTKVGIRVSCNDVGEGRGPEEG
jgi:chromosome segregation ATPase